MKLITLNTWGGEVGEKLLNFFKQYADAEVFLLQEVFHHATEVTAWKPEAKRELFDEIAEILPDHTGYFAPTQSNEWGLAAFIKDSLRVSEEGDVFVHRWRDAMEGTRDEKAIQTLGRNLQFLHLFSREHNFAVLNFHGLWDGKGKSDNHDRLEQSKNIIDFAQLLSKDFILAGDFNLLPDTQSLSLFEEQLKVRNLVTEYAITSTRTSFYTKPEKFADYIFASSGIEVKDFKVLPEEVSDHAALLVEFN